MQSTCAERCQVCLRECGSLRCTVWRSLLFLCLVVPFPPRSFFSVVVCSFALLCFLVFLRPRLSLVGRGGVRGSPPLPARSASGRPADPAPFPSGWRPPLRVGSLAAWSGFRSGVLARRLPGSCPSWVRSRSASGWPVGFRVGFFVSVLLSVVLVAPLVQFRVSASDLPSVSRLLWPPALLSSWVRSPVISVW